MFLPGPRWKTVLESAKRKKYAIIASNVADDSIIKGLLHGAQAAKSDILLQMTGSAMSFVSYEGSKKLGLELFSDYIKKLASTYSIGVGLHIDHGKPEEFPLIKHAIKNRLVSSVMIDASHLDFKDNVLMTKKVVKLAHSEHIVVEAELGRLKGKEDDVYSAEHFYTKPEDAVKFVELTDIDTLAPSIGTKHGFKVPGDIKLDIPRLKKIRDAVNIPLVLHGASSLSDTQIRQAVKNGICKINKDTEHQQLFASVVQRYWEKNASAITSKKKDKSVFDPRVWLRLVEDNLAQNFVRLARQSGSYDKTIIR